MGRVEHRRGCPTSRFGSDDIPFDAPLAPLRPPLLVAAPPPFAGSDDGSERARGSGEMNLGLGFWLPDICLGWDQLRPSIRLDGPVLSCVGPPHGLSAKSQMGQFQMLDAPRMTSDLSH